MIDFKARAAKYRQNLQEIGAWDNSMKDIPSGGTREVVEDLEAAAYEIDRLQAMMADIITMDSNGAVTKIARHALYQQTGTTK